MVSIMEIHNEDTFPRTQPFCNMGCALYFKEGKLSLHLFTNIIEVYSTAKVQPNT